MQKEYWLHNFPGCWKYENCDQTDTSASERTRLCLAKINDTLMMYAGDDRTAIGGGRGGGGPGGGGGLRTQKVTLHQRSFATAFISVSKQILESTRQQASQVRQQASQPWWA